MVWSVFPYESPFVTTTKEEILGIPCIKFRAKEYQGLLPTIISYHGWHSSKDFMRFEAMTIASHGYQVIVPDALYHGDREPIDHDDPKNLERYLWKIVLQSVKESKAFIQQIVQVHEADAERIGVIGTSMGAIAAGGVFVQNPELKCLVGINGTFAWQESIRMGCLPRARAEEEGYIEFHDPMKNIGKIKEKAILIVHGTDDSSIPIASPRLFYKEMCSLYAGGPGKLEMIEASNVDHQVTTGMLERAIMWFKEQL